VSHIEPDSLPEVATETTIVGEGRPPRREPLRLQRGDEVGRYVVLDQLGRGGMGVVYSAYDPTLDRKVALKVLLDLTGAEESSEGQPRLLREAQALAKLSHPNVITVHDVGTVGGSVFIAMEFIDGQTLTRWCETPRSWREIVAMLIAAGRGIAAAHRAKIVHRDFKPDNVMIAGNGRPRVLDFGLARAASEGSGTVELPTAEELRELGVSSTFDAKLTETGAVMGTPAYMAPEQHTGGRVDERTDQFAFCVSAYEALYGERPFAGESLAALAFQVCQGAVREAPKGTQVPSWVRKVLLRGLAVAPEERWPSMDALLRALDRDPVRKRRRVVLGAAVVAVVAGLGALVQGTLTHEEAMCTKAREHLVGVWDEEARERLRAAFAATELDYAEEAARGVEAALDIYAARWAEMHTEACAATRIRGEQSDELLTLRMACLDRHLARLDALVEVYEQADAEVVESALEAVGSLPPLRICADLDALASGVRPPETAQARERVEALRRRLDAARSLEQAGKRKLAREQLASLREEIIELGYRPLIAELDLVYGPLLETSDERVAVLEEAVWMAEASRHDRVAAQAWVELVGAYTSATNDFEAAEAATERADAAITRLGGDEDLRVRLAVARGHVLTLSGRSEAALEPLRWAHAERERLGQAGTPRALDELVNLTNALMNLGRFEEAEPLLRETLAEAEAQLGAGHPWVARLRATLGRVHYQAGEHDEAEAALLAALEVFERTYGDSQQVAAILNGLALVREAAGRHEEALRTYERGLELAISLSGPRHLHVAKILNNIASLERVLGRPEQALEHLEQSLAIKAELYTEPTDTLALTYHNLGDVLLELGELDRAEAAYLRCKELLEATEESSESLLAYPLGGLAQVAVARGEASAALALLDRADPLAADETELGPSMRGELAFTRARALALRGETEQARAAAERARTEYRAAPADYGHDIAKIDAWLARQPTR
jgi:tetratricopeptide (TPR) repeat protein/predicted Ser/Thr protein kinase